MTTFYQDPHLLDYYEQYNNTLQRDYDAVKVVRLSKKKTPQKISQDQSQQQSDTLLGQVPSGYVAFMGPPNEGGGDIVPIGVYTDYVTDDSQKIFANHDQLAAELEKELS